jgi:hypothetical protein
VAEWAVEVLNDLVEAELLSLPKDMQTRFLRIAELLESFGPQACWTAACENVGRKTVGDALERKGRNRTRDLHSYSGTAVGRAACICEENTKNPAQRNQLGA